MKQSLVVLAFLSWIQVCWPYNQFDGDVRLGRKLLQAEPSVDLFLMLGLPKADCGSNEQFGFESFRDEWNSAMRCQRCSTIFDLSVCDPYPRIQIRIKNRTTTKEEIQKLISTIVVMPECVLQRFSGFGKVQVNITRESSEDFVIPSVEAYNATEFPLLEYCIYEEEIPTDGTRGSHQQSGMNVGNVTKVVNVTGNADNLAEVEVEFETIQSSVVGERSFSDERDLTFGYEPMSKDLSLFPSGNATPYVDEVATVDIIDESAQPTLLDSVGFSLIIDNINCTQVFEDPEYLQSFEESLNCTNCVQFEECQEGQGVNGSVNLDASGSSQSTEETQKFISIFWRELICGGVDNQNNATIEFNELPDSLEQPTWSADTCDGFFASKRQILSPENPNAIPIQSPDFQQPASVNSNPETDNGDSEDDGGSSIGIWVYFLVAALIIIALVVLAVALIRRRYYLAESGMVGYPITPSPIATPTLSSAGRQAVLLARAEQFGYTPQFRQG